MPPLRYVYWQEGAVWIGYFLDYPEFWTQGDSPDDLIEQLAELLEDIQAIGLKSECLLGEWNRP
ncbi:MAG: type II toxin-antitoxin system HicB family antitoxin [Gemmataceae bacterium]